MKKLRNHQEEAIFMMNCNPAMGLFYGIGTGKTAISLHWILRALKDKRIEDALVVCPPTIIPVWKRSVEEMIDFEGVTEKDVKLLREHITFASYRGLYKSESRPIHHRNGSVSYKKEIAIKDEYDKLWGAIFMDESQNIASHSSNVSKVAYILGRYATHRYILSGTAVFGGKGRPDYKKLYGQLRFLDGDLWPTWKSFCEECVLSYDHWGNPYRYKEEHCEELMRMYGITKRLEDVVDMPPYSEFSVDCPLAEKKVYKDIKEGRILEYGFDVEVAGGEWTKLMQVCSGSLKTDHGTKIYKTGKEDMLVHLINATDEKIVIFCTYAASIERCAELCRDCTREVVVQAGGSKKDAWEEFAYGDKDAIVLQYRSGGPGLNLQCASVCIFYEPHPSADALEQAKGRIRRTGQTKPQVYYYLSTPDTVEVKFWKTVRAGVDVTKDMMTRWAREEN